LQAGADLNGHAPDDRAQVLDAVLAEAIATVFGEYVDKHGLARSRRSSPKA